MKRFTLRFQVFLSIVAVSLGTALTVGLFARTALSRAFDSYLATLPSRSGMPGRGMGRMMLGAAEQTFIASVDKSVYIAALVAVVAATLIAILLAAYLVRPLRQLESAAEELAGGELSHRVDVGGSLEVAALGEAFNSMADSLEGAEQLRRRLVADVAHELRNPLAAARAQAEGIVDGVLEPDTSRLESLLDDIRHLSALIDELQELAVAEAGGLTYEMAATDVVALAQREADRAASLLAPGVEMRVMAPQSPLEVIADERRLAQVLRNFLTNAARHTAAGSVSVEVESRADAVEVRVTDTGEGISTHDLEHVFERFYRADAARAANTGGAGLGLAISRSIVQDHGGEVFARSELGKGTTMGFTIPLPPVA